MSNKMEEKAIKPAAKREMKPRLRFPEFREAGEWEKKKISQIADLYKGKGVSKADIVVDGNQPCIRYGELYTSYGEVIDEVISKTNLPSSDLFLSKKNDVIIPASGETKIDIATASCVMQDNIALGGDLNIIRSRQNGIFLSYYLNGILRNNIAKIAQGDTVVHLYATQLELLDIAIPSKQEQQKIADCLSSLNNLVTTEAQKLDALKAHKKGLMQQLFPAEGETLPKLRFPEFWDSGEWEEKQLSQLTTKISDGIHGTPIYDENGEYAFINGNNLLNSRIVIDEKTKRVSLDEFHKHKKPIEANSILMSINGTIGNLAFFRDEKIVLGKSACFINVDVTLANKFFIYTTLQTNKVKAAFDAQLTGSTIKNLSLGAIKNLRLLVPTLPEQQKIADCLSSLDELITAQTQKLAVLKAHKKGLMQQLFPALAEVQG
jgi:type I restriction enzyme, S subunit